jgi:hypothetical protein
MERILVDAIDVAGGPLLCGIASEERRRSQMPPAETSPVSQPECSLDAIDSFTSSVRVAVFYPLLTNSRTTDNGPRPRHPMR